MFAIAAGMTEVAKDRALAEEAMAEERARKPKKWDENLKSQRIDYS